MQESRYPNHSSSDLTAVVDDYSNFYAALGVDADTDWATLHSHYRRLIGQWHPDRFSSDGAMRKIAEERSKQITIAYRALGNYRRAHGVLPPRKPAVDVRAQGAGRHVDTVSDRTSSNDHRAATGAMGERPSKPSKRASGRRLRIAFALFTGVAALYLAERYAGPIATDDGQPGDRNLAADVATQAPAESRHREDRWIWIGSTVGEVYAVQGVPDSTQDEIWQYGKSQIHFSQGKVISWNQHPDNPLRIGRDQSIQMRDGSFEVGSTKDEVRVIQGTPVVESDTVWDYGPSRVYFRNNRVIRWEESPMQPLRVAR